MTVRYRELPAIGYAPAPVRRLERPNDAEWGGLSISPGDHFFLTYYVEGVGSTILDANGLEVGLKPPDRDSFWFPFVQRFTDGRWLVVESGSPDLVPNVFVFQSDGSFSHSFYVGDGVAAVLVDLSDRIWIGFSEQGINGGFRLSPAKKKLRLGPKGLIRVGERGELEFGFNDAVFGRDPTEIEEPEPVYPFALTAEEADARFNDPRYDQLINDLNALTTDDEGRVWVCPKFLASTENDTIEFVYLDVPLHANAMCVGPDHFVFLGGYDRDCMVAVVERASQRLRLIQVQKEDGTPLKLERVATRGGTVIAIADDRLYRLDLDILVDALGPWRDDNSASVASAVQYREEEASYGQTIVFVRKDSGLGPKDFPGTPRPPENQPRNDDCGES